MHAIQPADYATPAAIRHARKKERAAYNEYRRARSAWYASDGDAWTREDLLHTAIDARYWWQAYRRDRAWCERVRDEIARGERDKLGGLLR